MSYSKFEALRHRIEQHEEHLIQIYEQQTEFARFHNALVWQVSSIFIPFSFAGLSLPFAKEVQLWLVGLRSMFVLIMWIFLAEWHQWLWVHSFYCIQIIEAIWGYRGYPDPPRFLDFRPPYFLGLEPSTFSLFGVFKHPIDWGRIIRLLLRPGRPDFLEHPPLLGSLDQLLAVDGFA